MNYREFREVVRKSGFRVDDPKKAYQGLRLYQAEYGVITKGELEHHLRKAKVPTGVISAATRRMAHNI